MARQGRSETWEAAIHVLIIDGHPDHGRLIGAILDHYASALPAGTNLQRIAVRDLTFDFNLRRGYGTDQAWEPDLQRLGEAIAACDHLVIGFPLWWGAEPAMLKGALDRVLLPGFAFRYHKDNSFWDRLMAGRSADLIITMDTPPWYLRLIYGDPVGRRWNRQVLGFCGFRPMRIFRLGPTRRGGAARHMTAWRAKMTKAAASAVALKRGAKVTGNREAVPAAIIERKS